MGLMLEASSHTLTTAVLTYDTSERATDDATAASAGNLSVEVRARCGDGEAGQHSTAEATADEMDKQHPCVRGNRSDWLKVITSGLETKTRTALDLPSGVSHL